MGKFIADEFDVVILSLFEAGGESRSRDYFIGEFFFVECLPEFEHERCEFFIKLLFLVVFNRTD